MRPQCDLNRQVLGHRSAASHRHPAVSTFKVSKSQHAPILLSSSSSFTSIPSCRVILLFVLTWSTLLIDANAAAITATNLNRHSSNKQQPLIDATVQSNQLITAIDNLPTTRTTEKTTVVPPPPQLSHGDEDKIDKSVPLTFLSSQPQSIITSSNTIIANDTNYRPIVDYGRNLSASSTFLSLGAPGPHAPIIHDSSDQFAQTNPKEESGTSLIAQQNDVHDTFLLMCSAHAIRFWSISCPVHSSNFLLSHSRPSSIKYGISSIVAWRSPDQQWAPVELIWFDVSEAQFHRAAIQRQHATDCDYLLGIEFNQTLDYRSNPFANGSLNEKRVRLAIDSEHQLLFASNYVQNRIDVYRLDSATAANNEMVWLASLDAHNPYDIAVDGSVKSVFWVENRQRICKLQYNFEDEHFLQMGRNLTTLKSCSLPLTLASPQALTLNLQNKQIIWSGKKSRLYRSDYNLSTVLTPEVIGQAEMSDITNLAMGSGMDDALYLSDDRDVQVFRLKSRQFAFVSIESNTLFGLLVVENLTMSSLEYSGETSSATTTTSATNTTTTKAAPVPNNQSVPDLSTPRTTTTTTTKKTTFSGNETQPPAASVAEHSPELNVILLLTIVPILILVIVCAIAGCCYCRSSSRNHFADLPGKFHLKYPTTTSCSNSHGRTASRFFSWTQRWARYNKMRKTRANSTGPDALIDEDIEQAGHEHHAACQDVNAMEPSSQRTRAQHFYRQNLMRQSSAIDDIEDMFGNGHSHRASLHQPCIACREQDICQDKGICMATYRVL